MKPNQAAAIPEGCGTFVLSEAQNGSTQLAGLVSVAGVTTKGCSESCFRTRSQLPRLTISPPWPAVTVNRASPVAPRAMVVETSIQLASSSNSTSKPGRLTENSTRAFKPWLEASPPTAWRPTSATSNTSHNGAGGRRCKTRPRFSISNEGRDRVWPQRLGVNPTDRWSPSLCGAGARLVCNQARARTLRREHCAP